MMRSWYLRLGVLVGLCALSVYLLFPSYFYYFKATDAQRENNQTFCSALPGWAHCAKLNLGLDLQGGVHLVMGVRTDKAIEHRIDRMGDTILDDLRAQGIGCDAIKRSRGTSHLVLTCAAPEALALAQKRLAQQFTILATSALSATSLQVSLTDAEATQLRDSAVEQTIKTIRNRADKLGVTEPTIARRGLDSVLIQLPGVKDPQHAIDIIGRTAQLEFTMVDTPGAVALLNEAKSIALPEGVVVQKLGRGRSRDGYFEVPEAQQQALLQALDTVVPSDRQIVFGPLTGAMGEDRPGMLRTYLVAAQPGITGDYLTNAAVQQNPEMVNDYYVTMTFDAAGAKVFEKLTESNVGKPMAILLDGRVNSAPVINERIGGGTARITLGGARDPQAKFQEAKDLVLVLKAGALPAPIEIQEKRQVGKSLGADTVNRGMLAMAVGTGLVVVFMGLYYRASGMMANFALLLNVLFMMAALATLEATLTLPGMAGIVLTIGMAVDANVLIFERIREELRHGKSKKVAIDAGYQKAFGTIFDSNITTMIAGVVLMQCGSGPVRGFAVTLIIGLTCSLYTAIVVTRLVHDALSRRSPNASLSI